jgi:hypothetical protein
MLSLLASPYVVFYPICRQYCEADSCRYYRFNILSALMPFFLVIIYRADARKENSSKSTADMEQREERTEKISVTS